jgi:hypothetical protein
MFNPNARLDVVHFDERHACIVVDDALVDPERLVQFAAARRDAFRPVDFNAYPGIFLPAPTEIVEGLSVFFTQQVRRRFDARRTLQMQCRLSMVTLLPGALRPYQWICHRDRAELDRQQSIQASVLYLFKDEGLGGTSFYEPARSARETAMLFDDATNLSADAFAQRYALEPGYIRTTNEYFTRVGGISAKWNRLIFYDGSALHSGDITAPEKLSSDPLVGRLTLNGFFTCRRNAA